MGTATTDDLVIEQVAVTCLQESEFVQHLGLIGDHVTQQQSLPHPQRRVATGCPAASLEPFL